MTNDAAFDLEEAVEVLARTPRVLDALLRANDLERPGRHPELGDVTLRQLLAAWVVHDLHHVGQIARAMAKRYAREVGPWEAYLSVLSK